MEDIYTDLAVHIQEVDSRSKSNEHRIDDLEHDMKETKSMQITLVKLANGVENMGNQLMDVKEDIRDVKKGQNELSDKVTTLENRPALETKKRWDSIYDKILWLVIGGIITFILSQKKEINYSTVNLFFFVFINFLCNKLCCLTFDFSD